MVPNSGDGYLIPKRSGRDSRPYERIVDDDAESVYAEIDEGKMLDTEETTEL